MPEVSVRQYAALQVGLRTIMGLGAAEAMPTYLLYTQIEPSMRALERYGWSGGIPLMELWSGERPVSKVERFTQIVENLHWVDTIGYNADDFADNGPRDFRYDAYQLGQEPTRHKNQYMSEIREAGTTGLCFDGTAFYGANHTIGSAADLKSNSINGTGLTEATLETDLATCRERFALYETQYKSKVHNPDMIMPGMLGSILICCHPSLYQTWVQLQKKSLINQGSSNILMGTFRLMQDPYLTKKNTWYADFVPPGMMQTKPFMLQNRQMPRYVDKTNFQRDERLYRFNEIEIGVDARYRNAYFMWQDSIRVFNGE